MQPSISVVLCTHNRVNYLSKAINSLASQILPLDQYEILVIENACTDSTQQVVEAAMLQISNLRLIHEPLLGLIHARNAGWKNAQAKIVAFIDDDAIAAPDWLVCILQAYSSNNPPPGCAGGKITPIWEAPRPAWLSDEVVTHLGIYDWSPEPVETRQRALLAGVNMSAPKALIEQVGGFLPDLGRKGRSLISNEDVLLQLQIQRLGYSCYYDPAICVQHHIQANRLTQAWFLERFYWQGVSDARMLFILDQPKLRKRLVEIKDTLKPLISKPRRFLRSGWATDDPAEFTRSCYDRWAIGYIKGLASFK